uniref:Uncharacterized protein n=1 Tax=Rhizochromulina marina TaxID=1034831 RepID=A0A7S2SWT3_9STRA|mmetsp:Transcript_8859/g.25258  ORF Transcript_8859/g.25258 Transcript_8859/m.25258 type:complete len:212 (+) Transcript_8859:50-685(+)
MPPPPPPSSSLHREVCSSPSLAARVVPSMATTPLEHRFPHLTNISRRTEAMQDALSRDLDALRARISGVGATIDHLSHALRPMTPEETPGCNNAFSPLVSFPPGRIERSLSFHEPVTDTWHPTMRAQRTARPTAEPPLGLELDAAVQKLYSKVWERAVKQAELNLLKRLLIAKAMHCAPKTPEKPLVHPGTRSSGREFEIKATPRHIPPLL